MPAKTPDKIQAKPRKDAQQGKYTDIKLNGIWGLLPVQSADLCCAGQTGQADRLVVTGFAQLVDICSFQSRPHIAIFYMTLFTIGAVAMRGQGALLMTYGTEISMRRLNALDRGPWLQEDFCDSCCPVSWVLKWLRSSSPDPAANV